MKYKQLTSQTGGRFRIKGREVYEVKWHSPAKAEVLRVVGDFSDEVLSTLAKKGDLIDVSPNEEVVFVGVAA